MTEVQQKTRLVSVFSSVLMLTFYGRFGREAVWALALSSALLIFLGGGAYFLRLGLSAVWVRMILVFFAVSAAQIVWLKQGIEPWWALAVLSLLLPAVSGLRRPNKLLELVVQGIIFEAAALCFFAVRSALELSASQFFWQQPAGHLSLLGLIALTVAVLDVRGEKRGT